MYNFLCRFDFKKVQSRFPLKEAENAVRELAADADLLIRTPARFLPRSTLAIYPPSVLYTYIHLSAIFTPTNSDPCLHTRK